MNRSVHTFIYTLITVSFVFSYSTLAAKTGKMSEYTPLTGCITIEQDDDPEGGSYFKQQCPGRDGFDIFIEGADARSWLLIRHDKNEWNFQRDFAQGPLQFVGVGGNRLEWRYEFLGGKKMLRSWIIQITGSDPDQSERSRESLYVFRVQGGKICFIGQGKNNHSARKIADGPKGCQ